MKLINDLIKEYHNGIIEIQLFPESTIKRFKKYTPFKDFIKNEFDFWQKNNTNKLKGVTQHFNNIYNNLTNLENLINTNTNNALNHLNNAINLSKRNNSPCIYSDTAIAKFLTKVYKENKIYGDGAFDFFQNTISSKSINNQTAYFKGLIEAFIFENIDKSFKEKIKAEELSLEGLKNKYSEASDKLQMIYDDKTNELNTSNNEIKKDINDWKDNVSESVKEALTGYKDKFSDLQTLYEEKLRIDSPAKYWNDLHIEYQKKGKLWIKWSIGSSLFLILLLTVFLYDLPKSLIANSSTFSITNLKGTIIFTLIVSVAIYLIRFFIKLSTSAYHLSRDAKERFQLTHIYLSMLKEEGIEQKDRDIILQSLFSRADTGLLKGDHTPTLPGGVIAQILKNIK